MHVFVGILPMDFAQEEVTNTAYQKFSERTPSSFQLFVKSIIYESTR